MAVAALDYIRGINFDQIAHQIENAVAFDLDKYCPVFKSVAGKDVIGGMQRKMIRRKWCHLRNLVGWTIQMSRFRSGLPVLKRQTRTLSKNGVIHNTQPQIPFLYQSL